MRGCTTGRGAKPRGTFRAGFRTGSGAKPDGTTGPSMWGITVADVPVSKMSKSLVRWGEIEKGNFVSSNTACQKQ
jgi:hypothetical protein